MTTSWENQPSGNQPETPPVADEGQIGGEPENKEPNLAFAEAIGPWEIADTEFAPFKIGAADGLSIMAICVDPQGHELEYSVSFLRGRDNDENLVAQADESDEDLQSRLGAAVIAEVNDPRRQSLIAKRFTE